MSNRENPSSGHLIEAAKLAVLIPEDRRPTFNDALTERDFDKAVSMLDQAIPNDVARPSQIVALADTDTGDENMEEGTPMPISTRMTSTRNGRNRTLFASGKQSEKPRPPIRGPSGAEKQCQRGCGNA